MKIQINADETLSTGPAAAGARLTITASNADECYALVVAGKAVLIEDTGVRAAAGNVGPSFVSLLAQIFTDGLRLSGGAPVVGAPAGAVFARVTPAAAGTIALTDDAGGRLTLSGRTLLYTGVPFVADVPTSITLTLNGKSRVVPLLPTAPDSRTAAIMSILAGMSIAIGGSSSEVGRGTGDDSSLHMDNAWGRGYVYKALAFLRSIGFPNQTSGRGANAGQEQTFADYNRFDHARRDPTNADVSSLKTIGGQFFLLKNTVGAQYFLDVPDPSDSFTLVVSSTGTNQQIYVSMDGGATETLYTIADTNPRLITQTAALAATRTIRLRTPTSNTNDVRVSLEAPFASTARDLRAVVIAVRGWSVTDQIEASTPAAPLNVIALWHPEILLMSIGYQASENADYTDPATTNRLREQVMILADTFLAAGGKVPMFFGKQPDPNYLAVMAKVSATYGTPFYSANAVSAADAEAMKVDSVPHYNQTWHNINGAALGQWLATSGLPAAADIIASGGVVKRLEEIKPQNASAIIGLPFVTPLLFTRKLLGSTLTATASDGTTMTLNGKSMSATFVGGGDRGIVVTETLAGAPNSGRQSAFTISVVATDPVVFNDQFTGTGTLVAHTSDSGGTWGSATGTPTLSGGSMYFIASGVALITNPTSQDDYSIYAAITLRTTGNNAMFVYSCVDLPNGIAAGYQSSQGGFVISERVADVASPVALWKYSPAAGASYTIRLKKAKNPDGTSTFTLFVDTGSGLIQRAQYTTATSNPLNGRRVGFRVAGASTLTTGWNIDAMLVTQP